MLIWHGHNKHIVSMNEAETNLVDIYKKRCVWCTGLRLCVQAQLFKVCFTLYL